MQQIKVKQTNSRKNKDALWRAASQLNQENETADRAGLYNHIRKRRKQSIQMRNRGIHFLITMVDSHYTFTPLNKGSSNLTCIQFIHSHN